MRRGIEIREVFVPTRLSAMHLRTAYAAVSPAIERTIDAGERAAADERDGDHTVVQRRRKAGDSR